jgi:hypothetical protein
MGMLLSVNTGFDGLIFRLNDGRLKKVAVKAHVY